MLCLTETSAGVYEVLDPQPNFISDCTHILAQSNELPMEFFMLTPAEGLEIGGKLALVLVTGFIFRAVAQALNNFDEGLKNE